MMNNKFLRKLNRYLLLLIGIVLLSFLLDNLLSITMLNKDRLKQSSSRSTLYEFCLCITLLLWYIESFVLIFFLLKRNEFKYRDIPLIIFSLLGIIGVFLWFLN